jgi:hypothetical protein
MSLYAILYCCALLTLKCIDIEDLGISSQLNIIKAVTFCDSKFFSSNFTPIL